MLRQAQHKSSAPSHAPTRPPPNPTMKTLNPHSDFMSSYLGEVPKAEGVENGLPTYSPAFPATKSSQQESFHGAVLLRVEVFLLMLVAVSGAG